MICLCQYACCIGTVGSVSVFKVLISICVHVPSLHAHQTVKCKWTVDKYLVPLELLTVYEKWDFVSYEDSIFMLHGGIIVPELFKKTVLETLCNGYPGIWTM